jgi:ABC-type transport system involved in multi-copper enzyme maturation permease subunit
MSRVKNLKASFEYEIEVNYRFPILECIIAIIVLVSVASALEQAVRYAHIIETYSAEPDYPFWDMKYLLEDVQEHALYVFGFSAYRVTLILAFLVPLLIAYNVARGFEEGTFQTMLTYPIPRKRLLLFKTLIPIFVIGFTTSVALTLSVLLTMPRAYSFLALFILSKAFWAHIILMISVMTLISVYLKKTLPSALAGIGIWYGLSLLLSTPDFPVAITSFINPIIVVINTRAFGNFEEMISTTIFSVFATMIIGLVMLYFSYTALRTAEV